MTLQIFAADVPRFVGPAKRLLVEGQRTNSYRNPRGEGAGSGWPTYWGFGSARGMALVSSETITRDGRPGARIRVAGTPTAGFTAISPEVAGVAAAAGQQWTNSTWCAQVAGEVAISMNPRTLPRDASNAVISLGGNNLSAQVALTNTPQLIKHTPGVMPTNTANILLQFEFLGLTAGVPADFTVDILGAQMEMGAFASSLVLPAVGAPAISSRAADLSTFVLPTAQAAQGTLVATMMLSQAAPAAGSNGLLAIMGATDADRFILRNAAGSSSISAIKRVAGATTGSATLGTMIPGTPFRVAVAWDATAYYACLNGGAVLTIGGANPAVSQIAIGQDGLTSGTAAFGEIGPLDLYPARLPDAALQTLTV